MVVVGGCCLCVVRRVPPPLRLACARGMVRFECTCSSGGGGSSSSSKTKGRGRGRGGEGLRTASRRRAPGSTSPQPHPHSAGRWRRAGACDHRHQEPQPPRCPAQAASRFPSRRRRCSSEGPRSRTRRSEGQVTAQHVSVHVVETIFPWVEKQRPRKAFAGDSKQTVQTDSQPRF
eukprot:COSAG04_NODE_479_length_13687_cov_2.863262_6_plen_175_part_00